jgi:hypothetical protein
VRRDTLAAVKSRQLISGVALALAMAACKPSSVADAEASGNVAWLDTEASPSAIEALGRLADTNPAAVSALQEHTQFGVQAYIAAWGGVKRGAKWGGDMLHAGLQDPSRANDVASAVDGRDPVIVPFLPDIEGSLSRLAAGVTTSSLAAVLASAGKASHDAVVRRLADKATRGAMCGGIASPVADADARSTLRNVPAESRDDASCVGAVVTLAATDDATMRWLAQAAEPGLLGAASKLPTLDCVRLHRVWADALAARDSTQAAALAVPLSNAVKRCPAQLDGVLADALRSRPDAQAAVTGALDPFSPDDAQLKATCAALPMVATGRATPIAKERAADTLAHGCKGTP